jgi:hypothetical protein
MRRAASRWLRSLAPPRPSCSCSAAGYFTWTRSKQIRIAVPLDQPLPGVEGAAAHQQGSEEYPPTECTQLDNGVRILSEATPVRRALAGVPNRPRPAGSCCSLAARVAGGGERQLPAEMDAE